MEKWQLCKKKYSVSHVESMADSPPNMSFVIKLVMSLSSSFKICTSAIGYKPQTKETHKFQIVNGRTQLAKQTIQHKQNCKVFSAHVAIWTSINPRSKCLSYQIWSLKYFQSSDSTTNLDKLSLVQVTSKTALNSIRWHFKQVWTRSCNISNSCHLRFKVLRALWIRLWKISNYLYTVTFFSLQPVN